MANGPIHTFKQGQIETSIWQGDYQGTVTYSVSNKKSYKTKDGQWKETTFYNDKESLVLSNLLVRCSNYIADLASKNRQQGNGSVSPQQVASSLAPDNTEEVPF